MQVKIFHTAINYLELEKEMNEWLTSKGDTITIINTTQSQSPEGMYNVNLLITIFYNETLVTDTSPFEEID